MRSSKNRSRSKSNRNRSMGNIVNRVFDSSGPEGKVRGTPQQIIDKYNQMARDAQLSNDPVAMENFQQHAEHYLRMLAEAQREAEIRKEQQEAQSQSQNRDRGDEIRAEIPIEEGPAPVVTEAGGQLGVIGDEGDSGLVETPESTDRPKRSSKPRKPKAKPQEEKPRREAVEVGPPPEAAE
ncbi:MAG: DUF4167 domain-containing protein [Pseudomonadota bacterium]